METIRVRAEFHTAHRQRAYPGKCRFVHGHTWRGEIVLRCRRFPRDECDMSLEFGGLKRIMKDLDHRILVTDDDPDFLDADRFEPAGVVRIPGRGPSVENVAWYVFDSAVAKIREQYPDLGVEYHLEVTIRETDNNEFIVSDDVIV